MADDPSSITRRDILKNAAIGSTSVIGMQQGSGDSRAATIAPPRDVTKAKNDRTIKSLVSTVKASAAYETYSEYFETQTHYIFQKENPAVYEIQNSDTESGVTYGVTFNLIRTDTRQAAYTSPAGDHPSATYRSTSDVTFHVTNGAVQESVAFVNRRIDHDTNKGTRYWIENGTIKQESLTMTRSEDGSVEVVSQTQSESGVSTQSMFGIGCKDCQEILKAICTVGCAAPSSLVCSISVGGLGGIACSVTADLICGQLSIPNKCNPKDKYTHWQLCKDAGFC